MKLLRLVFWLLIWAVQIKCTEHDSDDEFSPNCSKWTTSLLLFNAFFLYFGSKEASIASFN